MIFNIRVSLSKFTDRDFEFIKYLDPIIIPAVIELKCRWAIAGRYNRITDGFRTLAEQWKLYLIGRPGLKGGTAGAPVTWVSGLLSWHTHGLAFDVAPLIRISVLGYRLDYGLLSRMAPAAQELGFDWGYKLWGTDAPHFHYSGYLTIEEVIEGQKPKKPIFTPCEKPRALIRGVNRMLAHHGMLQYALPFPS